MIDSIERFLRSTNNPTQYLFESKDSITFFCNVSIEFSVLIFVLKPNCSSLIILNLLQKDKSLFENNFSRIF